MTVQGPVKEQQPDGMSHRGYTNPWVSDAPSPQNKSNETMRRRNVAHGGPPAPISPTPSPSACAHLKRRSDGPLSPRVRRCRGQHRSKSEGVTGEVVPREFGPDSPVVLRPDGGKGVYMFPSPASPHHRSAAKPPGSPRHASPGGPAQTLTDAPGTPTAGSRDRTLTPATPVPPTPISSRGGAAMAGFGAVAFSPNVAVHLLNAEEAESPDSQRCCLVAELNAHCCAGTRWEGRDLGGGLRSG